VRFTAPVETEPVAQAASCKIRTETIPEVKGCRGLTLTPLHLLAP